MNDDFRDLLELFIEHEVRFLVVGAHALAVHGVARATGDIDLFVEPDDANASRVMAALQDFGAPVAAHGVTAADLSRPGMVYQLGLPPRRIDILTRIDGVSFPEAWESRLHATVSGLDLPFVGRAALIRNKTASGRPKDLADLAMLEEVSRG